MMEKKGGTFGNNQDDIVLIPFSTAAALYGSENMRELVLAFQMEPGSDLDLAKSRSGRAPRAPSPRGASRTTSGSSRRRDPQDDLEHPRPRHLTWAASSASRCWSAASGS